MAIYSLSVQTIGRGQDRSAVGAWCYRAGLDGRDPWSGALHLYRGRTGVLLVEVDGFSVMPGETHFEASLRLWIAASLAERRTNSVEARELRIALPAELSREQGVALLRRFARWLRKRYQVALSWALHAPSVDGDERNVHAHLMITTRRVGEDGIFGKKTFELDDLSKTRGMHRRTGVIARGPYEVKMIRARWALEMNRELRRARVHERVDHRSYADQYSMLAEDERRVPTRHLGPSHTAFQRNALREAEANPGLAGEIMQKLQANRLIAHNLWAAAENLVRQARFFDRVERRLEVGLLWSARAVAKAREWIAKNVRWHDEGEVRVRSKRPEDMYFRMPEAPLAAAAATAPQLPVEPPGPGLVGAQAPFRDVEHATRSATPAKLDPAAEVANSAAPDRAAELAAHKKKLLRAREELDARVAEIDDERNLLPAKPGQPNLQTLLYEVYSNPVAAAIAFEREPDPKRLRENPEHFGQLRAATASGLLRRLGRRNEDAARSAAVGAADRWQEYLQAKERWQQAEPRRTVFNDERNRLTSQRKILVAEDIRVSKEYRRELELSGPEREGRGGRGR